MPAFSRVHVIINPAAGNNEPILNTLNDVFSPHDIDWDVSITRRLGDGARFAREALDRGVDLVAAYGGDGTLLDVADGIAGDVTPLALLPGGTANALVAELGIPGNLRAAASLIVDETAQIRPIDSGLIGELDENRYFVLRVGTGLVGMFSRAIERELKDRYGLMAYVISGVRALSAPQVTRYQLTIDGQQHEVDGVACLICNGNALGTLGLRLAPTIQIDDGLLDVFVMRPGLRAVLDVTRSILTQQDTNMLASLDHWQGSTIQLAVDGEPLDVYADGENEPSATTPVTIRACEASLQVLVPGAKTAPSE